MVALISQGLGAAVEAADLGDDPQVPRALTMRLGFRVWGFGVWGLGFRVTGV